MTRQYFSVIYKANRIFLYQICVGRWQYELGNPLFILKIWNCPPFFQVEVVNIFQMSLFENLIMGTSFFPSFEWRNIHTLTVDMFQSSIKQISCFVYQFLCRKMTTSAVNFLHFGRLGNTFLFLVEVVTNIFLYMAMSPPLMFFSYQVCSLLYLEIVRSEL